GHRRPVPAGIAHRYGRLGRRAASQRGGARRAGLHAADRPHLPGHHRGVVRLAGLPDHLARLVYPQGAPRRLTSRRAATAATAASRGGGAVAFTKKAKSSRAFASMATGRRTRPEAAMSRTTDRLRPNPVMSSFSTRIGTGSSNLTVTSSDPGSSRSGPD